MPRETVAASTTHNGREDDGTPREDGLPPGHGGTRTVSLSVGWNKTGWVQVYTIPEGWQHTGEWRAVDLDPDQIDHMIRVLKRAKRQAFGQAFK